MTLSTETLVANFTGYEVTFVYSEYSFNRKPNEWCAEHLPRCAGCLSDERQSWRSTDDFNRWSTPAWGMLAVGADAGDYQKHQFIASERWRICAISSPLHRLAGASTAARQINGLLTRYALFYGCGATQRYRYHRQYSYKVTFSIFNARRT